MVAPIDNTPPRPALSVIVPPEHVACPGARDA